MFHALLSFAVVAGLLTIVPGLDTALVLRAAVTRSRRHAFATALGIGSGTLIWGAAAAAGISAVLTASNLAYMLLRIVGAIYLIWMGASMLRAALRRSPATIRSPENDSARTVLGAWACGLGTNLLNPKVGVFYMAMIPQFIPPDTPQLPMGIALAALHNLEGMLWFTAIILAAGSAKSWFDREEVRRILDGLTGTVLIAFGVKLASDRR
ncbi:LysE family translocator [Nocardia sp. 2]|uniref:LysE family translocator n=1 Tax=Nocardia acididurans TaxID=2802282 RepID=A0ABS1M0U3_9NOCA|nr:LysE family translocator [Nocardia acididurans]MBL1074298.1 LysE family translocator [Nocardia acididurans]